MKIAAIYLYDYIGDGGYSAQDFANDLQTHKDNGAEIFHIHINSGGGSVFDGFTIYNLLKKENVEIYIDGWAASIASLIAMAGKKVYAYKNSFLMIHNPSTLAWGDENEMARAKDQLEMIKKSIVQAYVDKTGMPEDDIKTMMNDETWMSADEAKDKGFVDEIIETIQEKNHVAVFTNYIGFENSNKKDKKMSKELLNFLGLPEDATEEAVNNKLTELKNDFGLDENSTITDIIANIKEDSDEDYINKLEDKIEKITAEIAELKNANVQSAEDKKKERAENLVDKAVEDGKILPADKKVWVNNAIADYDGTKADLDAKEKDSAVPNPPVIKDGVKPIDLSEYDNKNVDAGQLALHKRAKEIQSAEDIDYMAAVKKAQKELQ